MRSRLPHGVLDQGGKGRRVARAWAMTTANHATVKRAFGGMGIQIATTDSDLTGIKMSRLLLGMSFTTTLPRLSFLHSPIFLEAYRSLSSNIYSLHNKSSSVLTKCISPPLLSSHFLLVSLPQTLLIWSSARPAPKYMSSALERLLRPQAMAHLPQWLT